MTVCHFAHLSEVAPSLYFAIEVIFSTNDPLAIREVLLPATRVMGYWNSMMGRLAALEMLEILMHQILSAGVPVELGSIHMRPDVTQDLAAGVPILRKAMMGTFEGQLAELKIAEFLDAWEAVNLALRDSGRMATSMEVFDRIRG